jgi:GNAT superfamily N-acetyltransferase
MLDLPRPLVLDLELSEVEVCRSVGAVSETIAGPLGLALRPMGSALATAASRVDVLAYNRVLALGVASPAEPGDLDEAEHFFAAAGSPRWMVNLSPAAGPPELSEWLVARGYSLHNHWLKLWRETRLAVEEPEDPRVRPFGAEHADAFARCDVEAFSLPEAVIPWIAATVGMPHWHHYAAFDGPDAVGFGALAVLGRVGWLGFASTKPTHRRQGIQSALIATRLRAAAQLGCEITIVETADDTPEKPNPSTHNLVRMGFRVAYRRPNWVKKVAKEIEPERAAAEAREIESETPAA